MADEQVPTKERALTATEQAEFAECTRRAMQELALTAQTGPAAKVEAVNTEVNRRQAARRNPLKTLLRRGPDTVDTALGLGAVWGNALVEEFHWEWTCIQEEGQDWFAVVSPDRALAIFPTYFVKACLDDSRLDCTAMLAFNMLAAGNMVGMPAQGYENVMQGVRRIIG